MGEGFKLVIGKGEMRILTVSFCDSLSKKMLIKILINKLCFFF